MKVNWASTIFQVSDLRKSIRFYTEVLGFEEEFVFGDPPFYAGIKMGNAILHLNSGKENENRRGMGSLYVFCDEVDSYYERIKSLEVEITSKLDTWPYGMRDFQLKDLDGNLLNFGCPVEAEGDEG
jgi:catechol 2,3-dioxygenase-like lactoylglutathione lyase family enzyme